MAGGRCFCEGLKRGIRFHKNVGDRQAANAVAAGLEQHFGCRVQVARVLVVIQHQDGCSQVVQNALVHGLVHKSPPGAGFARIKPDRITLEEDLKPLIIRALCGMV